MNLEEMLKLAVRYRAVELAADGMVITMHPSAFGQPDPGEEAGPAASETCACKHSLVTEHNETGCLHGCPISACEAVP